MSNSGFAGDWDQDHYEDDGIRHTNDGWDYSDNEDQPEDPPEDQPIQNRGWFGNDERDETAWSKSARGVNAWGDPNYRDPYGDYGNKRKGNQNPRRIKRGYSTSNPFKKKAKKKVRSWWG